MDFSSPLYAKAALEGTVIALFEWIFPDKYQQAVFMTLLIAIFFLLAFQIDA